MTIEIEALDTLIFQDGKPFDKSSDNWGNSLVMPTPSTIYGALRATYFANHPDELSKANESDDPTKELKINYIALKHQDKLFFPIPKDCVDVNNKVEVLSLTENKYTNNPLKYIFTLDSEVETIERGYLDNSNFQRYVNSKEIGSYEIEERFLIHENKIGIGLDKQRKSVKEGLLYRVDMLRYKDLKIVIGFDGLEIENSGFMRLGGEGKGAFYQNIEKLKFPKIEKLTKNIFKLYCSTPTIFKNGWYPEWIDSKNNYQGEFNGVKVQLIASSIGKYQSIGGFDIKKRRPKEMVRVVPTGSVYYFEILDNNIDTSKIIETFHLKSISEEKKEEGYGVVLVGDVK